MLGVGVGLCYSSVTTTAVTAVDASQSSLAGGIIHMAQIADGSVGSDINTAIVAAAASLADCISTAFLVDALLASGALVIGVLFIGSSGPLRDRLHLPVYYRADRS